MKMLRSDRAALLASRQRQRELMAAGWPLSRIAVSSVGFVRTREGEACARAQARELRVWRLWRARQKRRAAWTKGTEVQAASMQRAVPLVPVPIVDGREVWRLNEWAVVRQGAELVLAYHAPSGLHRVRHGRVYGLAEIVPIVRTVVGPEWVARLAAHEATVAEYDAAVASVDAFGASVYG